MKHWIEKNYKTLIIAAFLVPIITVAIVSISHVTKWYGISNPVSWSVYLSIGIEIAALSALAAISANMGKKVYFPFAIVTLVQFIGNIYFAYSYIDINAQSFKDWVGLVSPFVEFMGVDPNDFVGHKRFLAFFAGGMLPIISLSFLHMLVKFTEEDRLNESMVKEPETPVIKSEDIVGEVSRIRLSEEDLAILEKHLLNPEFPNEKLKEAAKRYSDEVREKHISIKDFQIDEERKTREEILSEMMKNDQELGLYDEDWGGLSNEELIGDDEIPAVIETPVVPALSDEEVKEMFMDEWERKFELVEEGTYDEEFSTIEPTEEDEGRNFSNIESISENIFQDNVIVPVDEAVDNEPEIDFTQELTEHQTETFNQEPTTFTEEPTVVESDFDGFVPEPFATPEEIEKYQIDQDIQEVAEVPVVNEETFGDNFDMINTPVIEKINIEESTPEVAPTIVEAESEEVDNDFWRQHVISDEEEDLKKNS